MSIFKKFFSENQSLDTERPLIIYHSFAVQQKLGGIKKIYDHVTYLSEMGFQAVIFDSDPMFRPDWFPHGVTKLCYSRNQPTNWVELESEVIDRAFHVYPESQVLKMLEDGYERSISFIQAPYHTFKLERSSKEVRNIYNKKVYAAICVSKSSEELIKIQFPDLRLFRINNSVNPDVFKSLSHKNKQIALHCKLENALLGHLTELIKNHPLLGQYDIAPIHDMSSEEVASTLAESVALVSLSSLEGFSLVPLEAAFCGTECVGFSSIGSRAYDQILSLEFSEFGDFVDIIRNLEDIISSFENQRDQYNKRSAQLSSEARKHFSPNNEKEDLKTVWEEIFKLG